MVHLVSIIKSLMYFQVFALLIFGKLISIPIIGLLSLNDFISFLLMLLCTIKIIKHGFNKKLMNIILLLLIMLLIAGFQSRVQSGWYYYFRQASIIFYMLPYLMIFYCYGNSAFEQNKTLYFLKIIILATLTIQLIYIGVRFFGFTESTGYLYYSPMSLSILSFSWLIIDDLKLGLSKFLLFIVLSFFVFIVGHMSLFVAYLYGAFSYQMAKLGKVKILKYQLVIPIFLIPIFLSDDFISTGSLIFEDNLVFRFLYWNQAASEQFSQLSSILFGRGLSVEYFNQSQLDVLISHFGHTNGLDSQQKRLEVALHNSFLTIFYHFGIFGFILVFYPIIQFLISCKPVKNGLMIAVLTSLVIWCYFNVILELPHSASLFWFVFFVTCSNSSNRLNLEKKKSFIFSSAS